MTIRGWLSIIGEIKRKIFISPSLDEKFMVRQMKAGVDQASRYRLWLTSEGVGAHTE